MPPERTLRALARFRCIAEACEDTCCAGTHITLGRREYERLTGLLGRTADTRAELARNVTVNPFPQRFVEYGTLTMRPGEGCGFLDPERLCSLQRRFGEAALPTTCATFPRVVTRDGDALLQSGALACPEVARLILLADDGVCVDGPEAAGAPTPRDELFGALLDEALPIEARLFRGLQLACIDAPDTHPGDRVERIRELLLQRLEYGASERYRSFAARVLEQLGGGAEVGATFLEARARLSPALRWWRDRALGRAAALGWLRMARLPLELAVSRLLTRAAVLDVALCSLLSTGSAPEDVVVDCAQICARYLDDHPLMAGLSDPSADPRKEAARWYGVIAA